MAKVTMSLHGFEAIQRAVDAAPKLVRDASIDLVEKSAKATAQRMRANAPVKTGRLKRAITSGRAGARGRRADCGGRLVLALRGIRHRQHDRAAVRAPCR